MLFKIFIVMLLLWIVWTLGMRIYWKTHPQKVFSISVSKHTPISVCLYILYTEAVVGLFIFLVIHYIVEII